MQITVLGLGTTGDVLPTIILAEALQKQGHSVTLAVPTSFEDRVRAKQIPYSPVRIDVQTAMQSDMGQRFNSTGRNPIKMVQIMVQEAQKWLEPLDEDVYAACRDAEVIVSYDLIGLVAQSAADALKVPFLQIHVMPMYPSRYLKNSMIPLNVELGGWFNLATSALIRRVFWLMFRNEVNQIRQTYGLPPQTMGQYVAAQRKHVFMHCYSSHVVPRPSDWSSHVHVTGYWFEDVPDYTPSPELQAFLEAGEPPLYIGFGSFTNTDPTEHARSVIQAVQQTKQRAILAEGWGSLQMSEIPSEIFFLREYVPHQWLFQQVKAIVHHGGAGTTAAGLRSGKPTALVPYVGDQFFWADRLYKQGIIPKAIPQKELNADNLAATIHQLLTDHRLQKRSAELGAKIQAEDGLGYALRLIEDTATEYYKHSSHQ